MNRQVMCDRCGNDFTVVESLCSTIEDGDLQVQYFSCPDCGARYQILTTDAAMRDLIDKRQAVQRKIRLAHVKGFRENIIRSYIKERDQVIKEQERLLPTLKKRGEEILRKEVLTDGNRGQS